MCECFSASGIRKPAINSNVGLWVMQQNEMKWNEMRLKEARKKPFLNSILKPSKAAA